MKALVETVVQIYLEAGDQPEEMRPIVMRRNEDLSALEYPDARGPALVAVMNVGAAVLVSEDPAAFDRLAAEAQLAAQELRRALISDGKVV